MKTNLVLTGNTETLDKEYNNILSGEWCLQNKNFKNKIADVNYKVIQYHWSDIEKKKKDFVYLNDLYPRLLKSFCNFLNFYHKTNKPERYWHIIIGPWLAKSLPILYDRWETIKFLISKNKFDKITVRSERVGGDVSREGVQRDLLPLIEGTTVATKYGPVKTDHILFIASGAFHLAKPSDLLPELQGRLPIRVELQALTEEDFVRILTEPEASLIKQYIALMATEDFTLDFTEEAINQLAKLAAEINGTVENIGARRLHTVLEKLLEEISFSAADRSGETVTIDADMVNNRVGDLLKVGDLTKFIL